MAAAIGTVAIWGVPGPWAGVAEAAQARSADVDPNPVAITPLAAQEAVLRTTLAQTAAVITRSGRALEISYPVRLAFAADGFELLPAGTAMLDLLAHSLREFEHTAIAVVVYTDAIGSNDYNLQQSQARAVVVSTYLENKGVAEARLTARGAGESAPLEAPNTPEGRDLNRRLQVIITPLSS